MNTNLSIEYLQSRVALMRKWSPKSEIIIAGGAVRDLILKRPVKDIDVWIGGEFDVWDFLEAAEEEFFAGRLHRNEYVDTYKILGPGSNSRSGYSETLKVVEFAAGWRCYPVQFIFCEGDDVRDEVGEFDFGFCRAWVDDRRLRLLKEFHEDANAQRMTLYHSGSRHHQNKTKPERVARIRAKYPDWKFRDLSNGRKYWSDAECAFELAGTQEIVVSRLPELTS